MHTDIPTRAELEQLLSVRDAACVSIYLPTAPEERGERERIEFKNLCAEALEQLDAASIERHAADDLRDVLDDLVDDDAFWARQAHSLAVFATPSGARTFQVANRLSPMVEVSDLARAAIAGNPDTQTDGELADASRRVLDELYADELGELRAVYEQRAPQGRASDDLAAIARAATFGAVDTAFVDIDATVPGFVDETDGTLTLDDADDAVNYGVVDEIARRVLLARGRVLAVRREDIPGAGPAAAILRYPV